jgi:Holliday junction DNA helicase RuvA
MGGVYGRMKSLPRARMVNVRQKILLHLADRIPAEAGLEPLARMSDVDGEVLAALTSLGYSLVEAQAALQIIPRDAPEDVETRLRLALQFFAG